jgi:hypothetical protein
MRKEEEEKSEAPGPEAGFYSLPRRVFPPTLPILTEEARVTARM